MIKNIIFDFGGVILDLRPDRCAEQFASIGIPEAGQYMSYTHQQGVLDAVERGQLNLAEFCNGIRALHQGPYECGEPLNRQIVQAYSSMADGIPAYKLDFCQSLRDEGYHVSLLSNTNLVHWGFCRRDFLMAGYVPEELFEHLWLSCEMGMAKPDPEVFQRVLRDSGYDPAETLFVDDSPKNCAVAETFGIHTFCAGIRTDWTSELRRQLVPLNPPQRVRNDGDPTKRLND